MKRLLCIISGMNSGGAETFLMKLYRKIDKTKYQMDFCINIPDKCFYEDEILSYGGKIYRVPCKSQSLINFKNGLYHVVKDNEYKYVLRVTSNAAGFLDLKIAKKAGAIICGARSSNSSEGGGWKSVLSHNLGKIFYGKYVDLKIAPSDLSAKHTFGDKEYRLGKVHILKNGIDLDLFKYNNGGRKKIRDEFDISDDTILLGHIGRFSKQKNHSFLISIFAEYYKRNPKSKLILVGDGELKDNVYSMVNDLGLDSKVIFAGIRSDIPDFLSALDVFVFPSLYEGMPNTVIEAQATGLCCLISDTITSEANITGRVTYLPIDKGTTLWVKCLSSLCFDRVNVIDEFLSAGYSIETIVNQFCDFIFETKL